MRIAAAAFVLLLVCLGAAPTADAAKRKVPTAKVSDVAVANIRLAGGRPRASREGGGEVALTVDPRLQREVERLLTASKAPSGAVVVSDVRTGRVLAWATHGSEGDLVRRAKYPGASLFKVVTATALLEGGHVRPFDSICHQGGERRLDAADVRPGCHEGDVHTRFDRALGKSLNAVFGRLAVRYLTPATLLTTAKSLGVGEAPPFDLPADRTSIVVPSDALGLARAAAGFGEAKMSPLGALFLMQTIANDGERIRLHVTGDPAFVPRVSLGPAMKKETAIALTRMLEVTTRSGTSKAAFAEKPGRPAISVAGKTGTLAYAEPRRLVSWFAGFAPSQSPEIAVVVLLANDEKWWRKGNDVARDVFDAYFEGRVVQKAVDPEPRGR